ncbi:putative ABC transport system ATP-binding protein [Seinonella peptonophila]|uniref:Putative ABC transport system ATP-binding protein n=1 Tax=Seinonella peptonophila TaxID=112248 RepID=A0A1M4ZT32_9BACL|nr:ABC transporter ATP-binding protein [Seinonella peptonophila]SHF21164.1 putative ABC transport system ATP-binding protein [Seinonella peptonophila]
MTLIQVEQLCKVYGKQSSNRVLNGINFSVQLGEMVGIMGPSGSGKTTLLNQLSTIDKPTSGKIWFSEMELTQLSHKKRTDFRRRQLGFIFQDFQLLDTLTVSQNIIFPLVLQKVSATEQNQRLATVTEKLQLESLLDKKIYELSGGQAQRVAIARALIHQPTLVLADEPTGNLDAQSSQQVMKLLQELKQTEQTTLLLVTHDPVVASYCDRVIFLKDGIFHNELYANELQQAFFQNILNYLSLLGGNIE